MPVKKAQNNHKINLIFSQEKEPKTYVNFYYCKLSLNIIYTITYITFAVFISIINRKLFYDYNFKFNLTLVLTQQIFCILFFFIVSHKSQTFKKIAGEISFQSFLQLKYYYISFAIIFILNTVLRFIGTQMIVKASMFQNLRKLVLVKVYFCRFIYR